MDKIKNTDELNRVNLIVDTNGNAIKGLHALILKSYENGDYYAVIESDHPNVDVGDLVNFVKTGSAVKKPIQVDYMVTKKDGTINTAVGKMKYKAGDFIINQEGRDMYAVDRDIFLNNYEILKED